MSARGNAGTAQAENSLFAMRLRAKCRNFVYARLHGISMLTRSYEHLVGAYGVVGFSGVKGARKSVFIADASASAGSFAGSVHPLCS